MPISKSPLFKSTLISAKGLGIGASPFAKTLDSNISTITKSIVSIADVLKNQKKITDATNDYERRKAEQEKRAVSESKLEKRFDGLRKAAEKIIAPVKNVLSKILDFFVKIFFGRVIYKIIEWMGDPKNASKLKSVIRFLKDFGPTLLSLYIVFGTSFGKFTRGLVSLLVKGGARLLAAAAGLGARLGIRGLGRVAGFVGGPRGKLLAAGIEAAVTVGGTLALDKALRGGESEKTPGFSGGGFPNKFKNFFSGFGQVKGQRGKDKIPAMLSDGEFVVSAGAVQKYGVDTFEAMNAAGGGTNVPQIIGGTTYAAGGGLIGQNPDPNYKDPVLAERLNLMRSLENYARSQVSAGGDGNLIKALNDVALSLKGRGTGSSSGGGFRMPRLPSGGGFMQAGNQVLNSLQSNFNTVRETARNVLGSVDKLGTSEGYKRMSQQNEKKSQEAISKYDSWVQSLPKGFLRDTMNRGLIPIPTGNELGMSGLTYIKAMLGPLGRPFRILSNAKVDKARQEMIDRTAAANGLMVGPDGKMSMSWNRVSGRGSGQYTDEFAAFGGDKRAGKFFNSTFGRWSGRQQGNRMVTDDVYNFNESVGYYAGKSRDALMKGNVGEGLHNIASMAGRFAQDIGWMNQRALGSEIDVGSVKDIDSRTGKPKTPQQIAAERARFAKSKPKTLPVKPPPVKTVRTKADTIGTGVGGVRRTSSRGTTIPRFSASTSGSRTKADLIGLRR
jgi:hypothetical protein